MILGGPNIKSEAQDTQASLSVAQLFQYNSCIRRQEGTSSTRHNKARETPLPIYVGLTVHARTRESKLHVNLKFSALSLILRTILKNGCQSGHSHFSWWIHIRKCHQGYHKCFRLLHINPQFYRISARLNSNRYHTVFQLTF